MKSLTLLIVSNNNDWSSWPEKIDELKKWFSSKVDFSIDIVHTKYTSIPFSEYEPGKDQSHFNVKLGVDPAWYDEHVTRLGFEYDIILFVVNPTQWPSGNPFRGWRTDRDQGPVQLQVTASESERIRRQGEDMGEAFFNYARHEILHALFMLTGQKDTTHYYWDRWDLDKALAQIEFPATHATDEVTRLSKILTILKQILVVVGLKKKLEIVEQTPENATIPSVGDLCEAIKEYEGWFPPGKNLKYPLGSLSWRCNNPGNLRPAGQKGMTGVKSGFAVFATYEDGYQALYNQILLAVTGKSKVYSPDMTLLEFASKFAPTSDGNDPQEYAVFVAKRLKVKLDFVISHLSH